MANQMLSTLNQMMEEGLRKGIVHHFTEDETFTGRTVTLDGQELINFGSCSYLALENHPNLVEGVVEAAQQFGTQFSSSRTYISHLLYKELEDLLGQMYGQPAIATASTTLGHLATIPVVVDSDDAVILDMQVHSSVQMATQLLKANGTTIQIIRHNDMETLEKKIQQLRAKHNKVWYFADGVYSMYGDYAPLPALENLLNKYECFHLYIDDAHGIGWAGEHGVGYVRSQMEHHPKMVLTASLNKSFAAAGGAVIFPNQEMAQRVRNCGGTLIFSGPIQPPMLGAACASAKLHLSEEFADLQADLAAKVQHMNDKLEEFGLPQYEKTDSPLFFVPAGTLKTISSIIRKMLDAGFYVNSASFPATTAKRGGIRFMVNGHITLQDINNLVATLAQCYQEVLEEQNSSTERIAKVFRIPVFELKTNKATIASKKVHDLIICHQESIDQIAAKEWDSLMANRGNFTHASLKMLEGVFSQNSNKANNWKFHYFKVQDQQGNTVLNTFFTSAIVKDDMLAPAAVSRQIEAVRQSDPDYLTSKSVMLGAPITKGEHLLIDRAHPQWKAALELLLKKMHQVVEEEGATQLMLRDFRKGADAELQQFFMENGLIEVELLNECLVSDLSWDTREEYLMSLKGKYRYNVRKEILPFEEQFDLSFEKPQTLEEVKDCYNLYHQVFDRAFEMNVHQLPFDFFEQVCAHEDYDIIRLYLKEERDNPDRKPIAVMFSYKFETDYNALIIGLNYEYVRSHNTYKQMLYQTVLRAKAIGCEQVDLAYTAELEKKKVGARPYQVCAFVQSMDHFNQVVISSFAKQAAAA
ncbi:MAG: bifunctional aminotransferase class I/II-fold pyridoxal phosphate-dependent enzyme/GNAT family N-acetyltransferase [Bacteroidota bacterium]